MDWNTLPLAAQAAVVYLYGCAFLTACFTAEWALNWWEARIAIHDNVDEHAERPNPL